MGRVFRRRTVAQEDTAHPQFKRGRRAEQEIPAELRPAEEVPPEALADVHQFFVGAAVSPFKYSEPSQMQQYYKMEKKIACGAKFLVTQVGWDWKKSVAPSNVMLPSVAGRTGTLASWAAFRALILSPKRLKVSGLGPTKTIFSSRQRAANSEFSLRKP